ncbi:glycoside hydrolase family 3 C-terminal domain-containing protein [Actinocorallia longicatena]|uniref:Glycoside hydrolase family 3 C-terminal domain-containing protein n=2 Tax=Actinocorallia longicatena TaxID=111803 RepID=A0ABP6QI33_9ACTN
MWTLPAVPALGLRSIVMSDGPIGVRGGAWSAADPSIALPSPTALAATWDIGLARRAGALLAQEARRKGVHVLLAPTVNLHRSPLGGRHFECFSEDPLLTGELAAGYVNGVQAGGVAVTVKHFVANDFETERMTANVVVAERALRELYLRPFEIVVEKARPFGIMTAYNGVNGTTMSEHGELVDGVLRGEWGFDGVTVSDWFGARDTVRAALGGLDVAMPGPRTVYGPALVRAVEDGRLPEAVVDEHVGRVLELARRTGAIEGAEPPAVAEIDGEALAREVAARSFTLLTNSGGLLPLGRDRRIALIGGLAKEARVMGGGSAQVFPGHVVSPLDGLTAAGLDVTYARGADPSAKLPPARFALRATAFDADGAVLGEVEQPDGAVLWIGRPPAGIDGERLAAVTVAGTYVPETGGPHRFAVEGIGAYRLTVGGEVLYDGTVEPDGDDPFGLFFTPPQTVVPIELAAGRPVEVSLTHRVLRSRRTPLPAVAFALAHREPVLDDDALMAEAVAVAAAADVAVVVVGTSKEVESEGFDRTSLRLPGRQDELMARVAAANPRTIAVVNAGSPVEMPWRDRVASILLTWFPGQEGGHALADVLLGAEEPGGRLPTTWPATLEDCPVVNCTPENGELRYDEGVLIGYRAWDRAPAEPAFAFGSGLGYTTWSYEHAAYADGTLTVELRNTGDRPGREVVQAYLSPTAPDPARPARWLAGFAVAEAAPGTTTTVTIEIPRRSFATWTPTGWTPHPGPHTLTAAHSLTTPKLTVTVTTIAP